jgi:hypothetical protein
MIGYISTKSASAAVGGSSAATDSMDSGVNSVAAQQPVASSA